MGFFFINNKIFHKTYTKDKKKAKENIVSLMTTSLNYLAINGIKKKLVVQTQVNTAEENTHSMNNTNTKKILRTIQIPKKFSFPKSCR